MGLDDGYFSLRLKRLGFRHSTSMVSVTVTNILRPVYISARVIHVDALDATSAAASLVEESYSVVGTIDLVLLDGVTYAGFNIVDPQRIFHLHGTPVAVVFRHDLDLDKIRKALYDHFADWRFRYSVIEEVYRRAEKITFPNGTSIKVSCFGLTHRICVDNVKRLTKWYPNPEPLRLADIIASAIGKKIFEVQRAIISSVMNTHPFLDRRDEESGQG